MRGPIVKKERGEYGFTKNNETGIGNGRNLPGGVLLMYTDAAGSKAAYFSGGAAFYGR